MTKLGDAIRRSQRVESAPMGFGAARPAAKPSMLVGAIGASVAAGADLFVLDARASSLSPDAAKKACEAAGDAVVGAWAGSIDAAAAKALHEAGIDFIVFDPETTPAAALLEEALGYVLVLPDAPEELFLRSLDGLQLEAVFLQNLPSPLTVSAQLELGRTARLAGKPLLAQVAADASSEELQCLRAAGVVCLLTSPEGVAQLKETVAALPVRKPRREEQRTVVSLPRGQAAAEEDDDDDDDDGSL